MKLKCVNKKCGHSWNYKGKSKFYVTCPECHNKFNIQKLKGGIRQDENNKN
jgi:hypothetical protein